MNTTEFRGELKKIMPGYKWTVHHQGWDTKTLAATGIRSAGLNRMSTLYVVRRELDDRIFYVVKSSGFGRNAPWLVVHKDRTLARALRGLQNHYERKAVEYGTQACHLEDARKNMIK